MDLEQAKAKFNYQHIKLIKDKLIFFDKTEKRKLLSISSISNLFCGWKFDLIPQNILAAAQNRGNAINSLIEHFLTNKIDDFDKENRDFKMVENAIDFIKSKKPKYLEKAVFGDYFYGFIDILAENVFFEIKSRNSNILELSTIIQCEVYKAITKKDYIIIQFNKKEQKTNIFESAEIPQHFLDQAKKVIQNVKEISTILQNQ